MLRVTILCVGKCRESYWEGAIAEYRKRLSRYVNLSIVPLQDEPTPENASLKEELQIKKKEGDRILLWLSRHASSPDDLKVALAIEGGRMNSLQFASKLREAQESGARQIVFIIGGSLGLSEQVLNRADRKLSFSDFTFPHQLMRVILLEQIYRACRINSHQPYHK